MEQQHFHLICILKVMLVHTQSPSQNINLSYEHLVTHLIDIYPRFTQGLVRESYYEIN